MLFKKKCTLSFSGVIGKGKVIGGKKAFCFVPNSFNGQLHQKSSAPERQRTPGEYAWQCGLTCKDAEFVLGAISFVSCFYQLETFEKWQWGFSSINNKVGMTQRGPHPGMRCWKNISLLSFFKATWKQVKVGKFLVWVSFLGLSYMF